MELNIQSNQYIIINNLEKGGPQVHQSRPWALALIYKLNGGRTAETRHGGKEENTPPKRGSSLPDYLDSPILVENCRVN